MTWRWISKDAVLRIHNEQLIAHGGSPGLRDEGLLDSALNRPRNRDFYCDNVSIEEVAASYAAGIVQNHPFVDGNKRTAFVVATTFLLLNDADITASESDVVETFLKLAAGQITEKELTLWFKNNCISHRNDINN